LIDQNLYAGGFNDRFRDAGLGGSPFGDPTLQGFLTGLAVDPRHRGHLVSRNVEDSPSALGGTDAHHVDEKPEDLALEEAVASTFCEELSTLGVYTTWFKLSMAGNLRDFMITSPDGSTETGKGVRFGHAPAAYCAHPSENVLYLGCHDNETLYDQAVLKANHDGDASVCARIVQMALGAIAVSQGIAFFHAGDDLLRSKSLDRDSYNSGDWFNKLLWDKSHNNFGV
jgi:pullulanase